MDPAAERVDKVFAAWDKPDSPGCSLVVVSDGQIIYERGYGCAHLEHGVPITPRTVFHVASVSKQFVAMSIYLLAKDGRLSVDDDVRKYIPELPDYGHTITLQHMIHHHGISSSVESASTRRLRRQVALFWPNGVATWSRPRIEPEYTNG